MTVTVHQWQIVFLTTSTILPAKSVCTHIYRKENEESHFMIQLFELDGKTIFKCALQCMGTYLAVRAEVRLKQSRGK